MIESGYDPSDFIIKGDDALIPDIFEGVYKAFERVVLRMKPSMIDESGNMGTKDGVEFLAGLIKKARITAGGGVMKTVESSDRSLTLQCLEHSYDRSLKGIKTKGEPIPFRVTVTVEVVDDAETI